MSNLPNRGGIKQSVSQSVVFLQVQTWLDQSKGLVNVSCTCNSHRIETIETRHAFVLDWTCLIVCESTCGVEISQLSILRLSLILQARQYKWERERDHTFQCLEHWITFSCEEVISKHLGKHTTQCHNAKTPHGFIAHYGHVHSFGECVERGMLGTLMHWKPGGVYTCSMFQTCP